uniref:Uncharacterized protein n=1 Tax=Anopheles braziliensis TaxID=58242 RepID=A0A2M3ZIP3_9DIPT
MCSYFCQVFKFPFQVPHCVITKHTIGMHLSIRCGDSYILALHEKRLCTVLTFCCLAVDLAGVAELR